MSSIQIKSLSFFRNKKQVLENITLKVRPGEITGLVGSSGSGKSTILKLLLKYPFTEKTLLTGDILVNGRADFSPQSIQPVFQDPAAYFNPLWTLEEILNEPLEILFSLSRHEKDKRIEHYLDKMHLDKDSMKKNIRNFSGGQLQRVAIIRALLCEPDFILMDEPVSALDRVVQKEVLELTGKLVKEEGKGVLFISHDLDAVGEIADYIYVIAGGKIVEEGKAGNVLGKPSAVETRSLLEARDLSGIRDQSI